MAPLSPRLCRPLSAASKGRYLAGQDTRTQDTEPFMSQPTPQDEMAGMITGYWTSQMVHVAAKLGLADHLAGGPRTADELAAATGTHARSLYRLLRALASVGIFSEADDGRFTQTVLSEAL